MVDLSKDKLGRFMASQFLESMPPAPLASDNTDGIIDWGMMGNDVLGDCTMAGLGHSIQIATINTGALESLSTSQIVTEYEVCCGYNPYNPSSDQGGEESNVLLKVSSCPTGFCGQKLLGYVSPDPKNLDHVRKAIAFFGSVYVGVELPNSVQTQKIWTPVSSDGGPAGGHCMISGKYDSTQISFITWGENQLATWDWWLKYVDECHILLWDVWLKKFPLASQQNILDILHQLA